jgi:DNA-binding NarL/FixJ family response regulator
MSMNGLTANGMSGIPLGAIMDDKEGVKLTRREVEVLTLVIEGNSSKQVAEHLYVSKRTVDFHLANIYGKLKVKNRVQAYREATKRGLLPVNGLHFAEETAQ